MENNEVVASLKKKPSYACVASLCLSVVGVILSALCFLLSIGGLLVPSIVVVAIGVLLSIWSTNTAENRDEGLAALGIASFFVHAAGVLFTVLAICF